MIDSDTMGCPEQKSAGCHFHIHLLYSNQVNLNICVSHAGFTFLILRGGGIHYIARRFILKSNFPAMNIRSTLDRYTFVGTSNT